MTTIGLLTAVLGFIGFFACVGSVVEPLRLPVIDNRVVAAFGTFASLAIMTVGVQFFPH